MNPAILGPRGTHRRKLLETRLLSESEVKRLQIFQGFTPYLLHTWALRSLQVHAHTIHHLRANAQAGANQSSGRSAGAHTTPTRNPRAHAHAQTHARTRTRAHS